jgi:uncharacterized protein YhaN
MRIDELQLKAFGPFTDRTLAFSGGTQGLHVIFGPNEAGKSSALRALKALLYGFEERTTDGFLHGLDQLRVGGSLRRADGRRLTFTRRKGRKNTLLGPDDRPLDDAVLMPYLSDISPGVFSSLFGIDHKALVDGGEQILQQGGEVGSVLFAAAVGSTGLQTLLSELEEEAGALYRPSASKYPVNKAFADYKDARREVKETSLAVKEWEAHRDSLEAAARRLDAIAEEMTTLRRAKNQAERLQRILPRVGLRKAHLSEIDAMGTVVELPADFGARFRALLDRKAGAESSLAADRARLDLLRQETEKYVPQERLLVEEGTIHALYKRLGAYAKAVADRPAIEGKRQQARNDARDILKRLRPGLSLDDVPPLRPAIVAAKGAIQDLAGRHQALEAAERKSRKTVAERDREIADLREELKSFPDDKEVGPLKRAAAEARRDGDLDTLLRDSSRSDEKTHRQCQDDLAGLGLWRGALEDVNALPVPSAETVDRSDEALRLLDDQVRRLADERSRIAAENLLVEHTLASTRLAGAVPTEGELLEQRVRRDRGWALVKRAWLEREDIAEEARQYDGERSLEAAYETATVGSDTIADRLRREADRVAAHAQVLARKDELARGMEELSSRESELSVAQKTLNESWAAHWSPCGIVPLSPAEMRAWLIRFERLKGRTQVLADGRARTQALREKILGHKATLASCLTGLGTTPPIDGGPLKELLERADEVVESIERVATKRSDLRRLTRERAKAAADLEHATSDLDLWRTHWSADIQPLELPGDARPTQVQSLLDSYTELFTKMDEEDSHRRRVFGIDQDIKDFREAVQAFVRSVAPELEDADLSRTMERLNGALKRATTDKTNRDALDKQVSALLLQIEDTETKLRKDEESLGAFCSEARCQAVDDLEEAERRSQGTRSLREKVTRLNDDIVREGDGATLDTLLREAAEGDADALPARLDTATRRLAELEAERDILRERKGAEENELRRMTGESTAAAAASKAQEILASMRRHVEAYMRTRVAATILKQEVERYRQANQDPLLVRGGALFASLSCGSFAGLDSEIADDEPKLVGVRPDGKPVPVEGMSSGARDQLYLALRFATLEKYLAAAEPMPFIVDDILINFDDQRARATLRLLADFSANTQVLLFTHHARVSEMAAAMESPNGVFLQELP